MGWLRAPLPSYTMSLGLVGRAPLFLSGILAAWVYERHGDALRARLARGAWLRRGGGDLVLVGVLAALAAFLRWKLYASRLNSSLELQFLVPDGLLWGLVILGVLLLPLRTRPLFSNRFLQWLGVLSYSIYLVHFPPAVLQPGGRPRVRPPRCGHLVEPRRRRLDRRSRTCLRRPLGRDLPLHRAAVPGAQGATRYVGGPRGPRRVTRRPGVAATVPARYTTAVAIRRIHTFPDAVLKHAAQPVEEIDGIVDTLLQDMVETMYAAPGIGLAAPQVGVGQRVIVLDVPREGEEHGKRLMRLINPQIAERDGSIIWEEGCLSVPEFTAPVTRAKRILLRAWTPDQQEIEIEAEDLLAVALQHELDHLDGKLFLDRISRLKRELYRTRQRKLERQGRAGEAGTGTHRSAL